MNTLLYRTLQDEPVNEKLIRGLQGLNDSSDRLIDAHTRMIHSGHMLLNAVDTIITR